MKNVDRVARGFKRVGDPASKYAYCPEQFEKDMEANRIKSEKLWSDFVEFMRSNDVDIFALRDLFIRYYEKFIA